MSKPNLVLIKNIDTSHDQVSDEFQKLKDSLPEGMQLSLFDIIMTDEHNWFTEAIEVAEGDKDEN